MSSPVGEHQQQIIHINHVVVIDIRRTVSGGGRACAPGGNYRKRVIDVHVAIGIDVGRAACRYGGEEFAVILPGAGLPEAWRLAEALRLIIADKSFLTTTLRGAVAAVNVTASVGLALYQPARAGDAPSFMTTAALIQAADTALYAAKAAGRNCVRVFGEDPDHTAVRAA